MQKMLQRGFTLIELLVVIAIIGILAAVVLGSLNDARDNANDASASTSMNNIRNQAEIFYSDNNYSYNGVCDATTTLPLLQAAEGQTRNTHDCDDNDDNYAATIELRSGDHYCVDSNGFAGASSTAKGAADVTCP